MLYAHGKVTYIAEIKLVSLTFFARRITFCRTTSTVPFIRHDTAYGILWSADILKISMQAMRHFDGRARHQSQRRLCSSFASKNYISITEHCHRKRHQSVLAPSSHGISNNDTFLSGGEDPIG